MRQFLRRSWREERAGSLVEALVAAALLGIALIVLVGTLSTFAIGGAAAKDKALAQTVVRAQAARIKQAPYSAAGDYSAVYEALPAGFSRTVTVMWWDGTSGWSGTSNVNGLEKVTLVLTHGTTTLASLDLLKADR
jgi:Tfp pilus assembly protein PilV